MAGIRSLSGHLPLLLWPSGYAPQQTSMLTMTIEDVGSTCAVFLQHSRQRFGMGRQLYEASGRRRLALD
jgi:hypothetical protein